MDFLSKKAAVEKVLKLKNEGEKVFISTNNDYLCNVINANDNSNSGKIGLGFRLFNIVQNSGLFFHSIGNLFKS